MKLYRGTRTRMRYVAGPRGGTGSVKRYQATIIIITFVLIAACGGGGGKGEMEKMEGGAPDFALPSVDGSMVRLSDYQGKVIMVDFWATLESTQLLLKFGNAPAIRVEFFLSLDPCLLFILY